MLHFRFLTAIAVSLFVANCTPEYQFQSSPPFSPEWCAAAKALPRSGQSLLAIGQCHERDVAGFPKDDNVINFYYAEAARRGNTDAGAALARRGQPVPDDDIRREAANRRAQEFNTRIIADAMRPPAPPPPIVVPVVPRSPSVTTRPMTPLRPSVDIGRPTVSVKRQSTTTSMRRNCSNNVCRVERTTCTNGVCTTTVSDR